MLKKGISLLNTIASLLLILSRRMTEPSRDIYELSTLLIITSKLLISIASRLTQPYGGIYELPTLLIIPSRLLFSIASLLVTLACRLTEPAEVFMIYLPYSSFHQDCCSQ